MNTYIAGLITGLIIGASATVAAWALATIRSWAEHRAQHRLEPLPGPAKLSDQIISATSRHRSLDRRFPEFPARDEAAGYVEDEEEPRR
jgi:hypothetical protein